MGLLGSVALQALIALAHMADRGIVSFQRLSNLSLVMAGFLQKINLISFLLGKRRVAAPLCSSYFGRWENATLPPQLVL